MSGTSSAAGGAPAEPVAVEVAVAGRVQGVSFRAYAAQEAGRLRVAGWVRNEPDGSVTAHVEGPRAAVDAMVAWLHHGPRLARVDRADVHEVPPTGERSFDVRY